MTDMTDLYADPRAAANAASEAVRALNHATLDTTSLAPATCTPSSERSSR